MNGKDISIIAIFCTAIVGMLLRPLVVAWSRRLSGDVVSSDLSGELEELRHRVAELESERGHLAELSERVDFAERMLAQRHDASQLPLHRTPV